MREKVLVAMSGGVDSSVAAALLVEAGHDVMGVFMRVGHAAEPAPADRSLPMLDRQRGCCSALDAGDARSVAARLAIPFYALNFEQDFDRLIDHFAAEYAAARTPNPCVRCNQWLKFGRLLEYADLVGAPRLATGHYARIDHALGQPRLGAARDERKDQSYVLFGIPAAARARTLFPLGALTKDEVRAAARRFGLPVHDKPESQDICFVPDGDHAAVVARRQPDALRPGLLRHADGRLLGTHAGRARYTVGQRHGLRVALGAPVYVTEIDAESNVVTVGPRAAVLSDTLVASKLTWWDAPAVGPVRVVARIRSNHRAAPATLTPLTADSARIRFDEPQLAITPGQAVVAYDADGWVLAGGWIERGGPAPPPTT
ncbi:MAG: tRNA 2-thiouridine(34) synthase MnmA [Phycisphaerae bacterium]